MNRSWESHCQAATRHLYGQPFSSNVTTCYCPSSSRRRILRKIRRSPTRHALWLLKTASPENAHWRQVGYGVFNIWESHSQATTCHLYSRHFHPTWQIAIVLAAQAAPPNDEEKMLLNSFRFFLLFFFHFICISMDMNFKGKFGLESTERILRVTKISCA